MQKRLSVLLSLILISSFVLVPTMAGARTSSVPEQADAPVRPARVAPPHLKEVPPEIVEMFEGGMSIDEFVALNKGRIPKALESLVDAEVNVVVELEGRPLAELYAASGNQLLASTQQSYLKQLENTQAALAPKVTALGAQIISRYQKAYNGFLIRVPANKLADIRALPGVRAIHRAPVHRPALANSVPLINADDVVNNLGFDGDGVSIAVIDTGIDYLHAAFGGSGDPADYDANDPNVVEPGTFPTAKVVGGFDFAGPYYDASGDTVTKTVPITDTDPLDVGGHGTHVASIAAGMEVVTGSIGAGVAPGAELYALKVFGDNVGSTNLTVDAIEWAMDPNGDGDMSDHVDVINMSLGSDFGPASDVDPDTVASNNAAAIGIVVVSSAGNAGDSSYIVGSPASADAVISVAASTTGFATGPTVTLTDTTPGTQVIYQPPAFDDDTGHFTQTVTADLFDVSQVYTSTLCTTDGFVGVMTDTIALIERGSCAFSVKVNNAASLGAVGAIIFNSASGGNSRVTMIGDPVAIPAGFVARDDGLYLKLGHGTLTEVSAEDDVSTVPDPYVAVDNIAGFSSRGPRGYDSYLKPEITAPGVGIFAANVGSGMGGTTKGGTSMASPHVAGVAALMQEAHPGWTVEQVKATMMNTAVDLADGSLVPRYGAGRVDAYEAVMASTAATGDADLVSLSWGVVPVTGAYSDVKSITVHNWYTDAKTFDLDWSFSDSETFTEGLSLDLPATVMVGAQMSATVPVTLNLDASMLPNDFGLLEEFHGFVNLTNQADATETLRVPFYLVPRPWTELEVTSEIAAAPHMTSTIYLTHTGPITSSLWVYPAYIWDANESGQGDEGDVRLVGMDYGWLSGSFGDMFVPSINTYGQWHTPQPFFAEFDLYLDTDEDGSWDFVDFNYNYGWWTGSDHNNVWVVIQVDLAAGLLYLGSPYTIYSDFNAGFMEWYLPATWNGLEDVAPTPTNTDFDFQLYGFDDGYFAASNADSTYKASFDIAKPPLDLLWSPNPGPANSSGMVTFKAMEPGPKGVMVVDYAGAPGTGQAYFVPYGYQYMPVIIKQ